MGSWSFSKTIGVWDDHPLLDCLYEYAEVECEVWVNCDLYFGFSGSGFEPPEDPAATFESAEVTRIDFLPHDKEEGDLKVRFLLTPEMKKEIEKIALKKVVDDWDEAEVFRQHEDYYSDGPDRD
jgi:hypothetical protein